MEDQAELQKVLMSGESKDVNDEVERRVAQVRIDMDNAASNARAELTTAHTADMKAAELAAEERQFAALEAQAESLAKEHVEAIEALRLELQTGYNDGVAELQSSHALELRDAALQSLNGSDDPQER